MKKLFSLLLALVMLFGIFSVVGFAAEDESVTVKFLNCNVAGLPDFNALLGKGTKDVKKNERELGEIFNASDYDVIAVQEDFSYHDHLAGEMKSYKYVTNPSGGIPGGDGLNVFTKNTPIYDEARTTWNSLYGGIAEGDPMTAKGILYTVLDFGNGITVDFYDLHADAFGGVENSLSRADNYKQLMELVELNSADRPVIITGDFNTSIHLKGSGDDGADEQYLYDMSKELGFKDAWVEVCNNGDYDNFSSWYEKYPSTYWGVWDSVEKFYYRGGSGVEITAETFEYLATVNADGQSISDHNGAVCKFTFTKTAEFEEDMRVHQAGEGSALNNALNVLKWLAKDLFFVFNNFEELLSLAGIN